MADNFITNAGEGGNTYASDEISSVHYPRVKLIHGADGTNDGDVASANPLPVVDSAAGTLLGTIDADTSGIITAVQIMDDWDESDRAKVNLIVGQAGIAAGAGAVAATVPRVTLASDDPGVALLTTIDADTSNMATSLGNLDNAVDGNYLNVNLNVAGSDIATGAGNVGATTPRVTLASNDPSIALQQTIATDTGQMVTALQLIDNAVSGAGFNITQFAGAAVPIGGGVEATALRVTLANDSTGVITVDGTVTANLSATDNAVLDDIAANQTDGSQKTQIVDGSGNVIGATSNALDVNIKSGGGSGGTAAADDADFTAGTTQGTPAMGVYESSPTSVTDGDLGTVGITETRALKVAIVSGAGSGGTASDDDADFTAGTTAGTPSMGVYESSPSSVTDGDMGIVGMTQTRAMRVSVDNAVTVDLGANNDVTITGDALTSLQALDDAVDGNYLNVNMNLAGTDAQAGEGTISANTLRVTIATDDDGVAHLATIAGAVSTEMQCDIVGALPAGDNNIGNVDIVSLPSGNIGQQAMAASVSVVPANNITDATYIGDIKFGEALPAGTNLVGKVSAGQDTAAAYDGTTSCEIKEFMVIGTTAGNNTLVAAVVDKKIRLLSLVVLATSATANTFYLVNDDYNVLGSAAATIPIAADADADNSAGFVLTNIRRTTDTANQALVAVQSATAALIYMGTYIEV